jgi:hypothetical protein
VSDRRFAGIRLLLLRASVAAGVVPLHWRVVVAARDLGAPFLVTAARDVGVPGSVSWSCVLGTGPDDRRGVFLLRQEDQRTPGWALKFSRLPDGGAAFDRDEHALAAVHRTLPNGLAARVPRFLGRVSHPGVHASLETAAPGRQLALLARDPRGRRRLGVWADRVADWLVQVAAASTRAPGRLEPELARLRTALGADERALASVETAVGCLVTTPGVLVHNDLDLENVVVDGQDFTVLDWEQLRDPGLPLWDLLHFLACALVPFDRSPLPDRETGPARAADEDLRRTVRLFRGESASSPLLFSWIRTMVHALQLRADMVGPIATLLWLDRASSVMGVPGPHGAVYRLANAWMADPDLGSTWSVWQQ